MDSAFELTQDALVANAQGDERWGSSPPPDLSHHLSKLAKNRDVSPLKGIMKYNGVPGMISLAGGTPHPSLFPFETLSSSTLPYNAYSTNPPSLVSRSASTTLSWLQSFFVQNPEVLKIKRKDIIIPKYASSGGGPEEILLERALQYGGADGLPALQTFLKNFTHSVFQPCLPSTVSLVNTGATDGWSKIVQTLCEEGDGILVEEWTYPSAMGAYLPYNCKPVPVAMDGVGMLPADLDKILTEWDVEARGGMKKPHVMYTVPVGQNPTGATMGGDRKKAIYEVCVKHDVIICEDDPYYFLQFDTYVPKSQAFSHTASKANNAKKSQEVEVADFLESLAPSFLKFDYQGRVIRIDTFSKTICPGSRLGFFTGSPLFLERLQRASETSTQSASGFSQALVTKLISEEWGIPGYTRWLMGIRATYTMRRDWICDLFDSSFHLEHNSQISVVGGLKGVSCYAKRASLTGGAMDEKSRGKGPALISFIPPTSGMFVWLRIHVENHPDYQKLLAEGDEEPTITLMDELWTALADNKVLVSPGAYFSPYARLPGTEIPESAQGGFFRLAFSMASHEQLSVAVSTMEKVIKAFFRV